MRWLAFGFGAALGIVWLESLGRAAMANEQAACLTRKLLRERRAARWRMMFP